MRRSLQKEEVKTVLFLAILFASLNVMASVEPHPQPVFLKLGYSSVLEFDDLPTEVVIGNSKLFQIEQLNKSLVVRPLVRSASTNAFVYFKSEKPKLLLLTASDETTPNYYRKIPRSNLPALPAAKPSTNPKPKQTLSAGLKVGRIEFRVPRDFLTIDLTVSANSTREISPRWDLARLNFRGRQIPAVKVWSSRRQVMRDSTIKARFTFAKPDVPASLKEVSLTLPLESDTALTTQLGRM